MAERVAVIGAGSWGTALAMVLAGKGHNVTLWAHRPGHARAMIDEGENRSYLPGFPLGHNIIVSTDIQEAVAGRPYVVMVVPSHGYRSVFEQIIPHLENGAHVISAAKGIENTTLRTMSQLMEEELAAVGDPEWSATIHLGVLAGPSFAKEVADQVPTAVTVAAKNKQAAQAFQDLFFTERFRVYAATDVIGLELGGALKNIIAIGAGICDGLGYGTNTRAALITRGLAEITRLGVRLGANPLTFSGLGGLGDLVLTCTGDLSRNRQVGLKLGQGKTIQQILDEMHMVAEGVKTTQSAWNLAKKHDVDMPILEQVYKVLYEDKPCQDAVHELMSRSQKEEVDFLP